MVKVVSAPPLTFKCSHCGATCEGEESEFRYQHTNPPTWLIDCGFCRMENRTTPKALTAKHVGSLYR